jgi:hypothetical protein
MPRLTKTDAALRAVILGKAPLKTKLEALAAIEYPSETFLMELISSSETHSKLKLKATERLKRIQHTREVDRILAEEALRLGLTGPVATGSEKPVSESIRKTDGPRTDIPAVTLPVVASPIKPTPIEAPVGSKDPKPAKVLSPAPVVDTATHPTMPADPQPIFILPRGSFISHEEQARLLQLFRIVADTGKSASQRRGARFQLERVVAIPDAARSLFSIYLLATIDWLERNPDQRIPNALAGDSPVMEADPGYEAFSFNFSTNQWIKQQVEEDRARRQIDRANTENKGGGMWDGLPAI